MKEWLPFYFLKKNSVKDLVILVNDHLGSHKNDRQEKRTLYVFYINTCKNASIGGQKPCHAVSVWISEKNTYRLSTWNFLMRLCT